MINLIIGERQSGKTQKLVEKAIELFLQGKKVGVVFPNWSHGFPNRCISYLLTNKIHYEYSKGAQQHQIFSYTHGGSITFFKPDSFLIPGSALYINRDINCWILEEWEPYSNLKLEIFDNVYISGNYDVLKYFVTNKINHSVEFVKRKKQNFTREEVLDLIQENRPLWQILDRNYLDNNLI